MDRLEKQDDLVKETKLYQQMLGALGRKEMRSGLKY